MRLLNKILKIDQFTPGTILSPPKARYLKYENIKDNFEAVPGLQHQVCNLITLFEEALYLNRIPIVPPLIIPAHHNRGTCRFSYFEKYFSFAKIAEKTELMADERFQNFSVRSTQQVDHDRLTETLAALPEQLVIRRFPDWNWFEVELCLPQPFGRRDGTSLRWENTQTWPLLEPSIRVRQIASEVMEKLQTYCALHVRRGDKSQNPNLWPEIQNATTPNVILNRIKSWIPPGENLYILSDERDPDYFGPLRAHYRVFQYFDFPQLFDLEEEEDNFMLFCVENELLRHARIGVGTYKNKGLVPMERALIE